MKLVAAIIFAALAAPLAAAEIKSLDVSREDGRVHVKTVLRIEAPQALVFEALSDYDRFSELSSRYLESRFAEPAPDGTPRIYTHVEGCVLFFCRSIKRYARLELTPDSLIVATAEPDNSEVKYGYEHWRLESVTGGTIVSYVHEMEPEFWVPPLLGVWAIRRELQNDGLKAARKIEALALRKSSAP